MLGGMDSAYYDGAAYDPETVRYFDVAHEGAQIRVLGGAISQLAGLLGGAKPRCLVILPTDQIARAAAYTAVGLAEPARIPLVVAESLPHFVGALDVVVVVGERAECDWASRALIAADKRGAATVLVGPSRGPLVEDAPESTFVAPTLPTAEGASPARFIAALYAVAAVLEEEGELVARRLEEAADAVDRELEALSPEHDSATNPGRELREFVEGARVIHSCGVDPYSWSEERSGVFINALVARMAAAVWAAHGLGGTFADPEALPHILERAQQRGGTAVRDIFFDPQIDPPEENALVSLKIVLWGEEEANLPHSIAESSNDPEPALGELARALQFITRSYAATAYEIS